MFKFTKFWIPVYEGDDDKGDKGDDDKGDKGDDKKTFTQEEVNKILADDKRKHQEKNTKLMDEIEAYKAKQSLTDEERQNLEKANTELRKMNMTAEQLKKEAEKKLRTDYEGQITSMTTERDDWKNRFTTEKIQRSIVDAAASHDAFVPAQVVAILKPQTHLVEAVDDDGKPTGGFTPKVTLKDTKEGKPITLELSPADAVKRMTEMDEYLNLFKGKGSGGIGGTNRSGSDKGGKMTAGEAAKALTPAEYKEWRKKNEV